jgi:monoamine oxidase
MPDGGLSYRGSPRGGYSVPLGAGPASGTLNPHIAIDEILASGLWNTGLYADLRHYWQSSMLQPRGGMDQIIRGFLDAQVPGGRRLRDLVETRRPVTAIRTSDAGVAVMAGGREERADYCISTMAPPLLAATENNFSPSYIAALNALVHEDTCKVGWQAKWRFWETNDQIYGGISWTTHEISQSWSPSNGHLGPTGVLTGTYNSGPTARAFGALSHEERLARALDGGERLHPGFTQWVHRDRGVSIAWQNMPFLIGGWAKDPALNAVDAYRRAGVPEGRLYLAGDFLSHMPGWKEGAVTSAQLAVERIAGHTGNAWRAAR